MPQHSAVNQAKVALSGENVTAEDVEYGVGQRY
jgi:hypothetical protein